MGHAERLVFPGINRDTRYYRVRPVPEPRRPDLLTGTTQELETVFGNLFRDLEARFPWLSTWLGGRLEVELPAFLVSLTMHGLLLVGLAFAGYRVHQESSHEFQSGVVDNTLMPSDSTYQDLDQTANPPALITKAGSFTPNLAPAITTAPSSAGVVPTAAAREAPSGGAAPELVKLDVRRATELIVPTATMLGQTVSIRGDGAELVGGVEGAVDRIAIEVLRHLERRPNSDRLGF